MTPLIVEEHPSLPNIPAGPRYAAFKNTKGTWSIVAHAKPQLRDEFPSNDSYVAFLNAHGILDWHWTIKGDGALMRAVRPGTAETK
jgi:hypothetical protein